MIHRSSKRYPASQDSRVYRYRGTAICLIAFSGILGSSAVTRATVIDTSTENKTNFESGDLSPLAVATTQSPNFVRVEQTGSQGALVSAMDGTHYAESFWTQNSYNGTRDTKGAEVISDLNFTKEGWEGFSLYVPSTAYPTNKTATVAQIFCDGLDGKVSWGGMLLIQNNQLRLVHRSNDASVPPDANGNIGDLIATSVPRDTWVPIILHFVVSRTNKGSLQAWFNGAEQSTPTYSMTGIKFGFGGSGTDGWNTSTDTLSSGAFITLKLGQYDWDTDNYTTGETRTLYYDSPTELVGGGTGGWAIVNPVPEPNGICLIAVGVAVLGRRRGAVA